MKLKFLILLLILYVLNPFKLDFVFGYILVGSILFSFKELKEIFDNFSFTILLFSVVYGIFYSFNPDLGVQFIVIYSLFPFCFYFLGKHLFLKKPKFFKSYEFLVLIGLVLSITALISTSSALMTSGFNILNRNVINFWTGIEENATYTGGFFLLNMCIPGVLIINWRNSKIVSKILLFTIYFLSVICVLRLGSRTQLVISAFSIATAIFYLVGRQSTKKNLAFLTVLFIMLNMVFAYVNVDKDADFISAYTTRMESKKYGANTAGGRTERWEKSFEMILEKPLGWELEEFGYSHNLWLDVLRVSGIISFILLLLVSFLSFKMLFKSLRRNKEIDSFLGTTAIYFVAFNLLFFVEPIFEGYFEIFVLHCFYLGLLSAYTENTSPIAKETIKLTNIK